MGLACKGNQGVKVGQAAADRLQIHLKQGPDRCLRLEPRIDGLIGPQCQVEIRQRGRMARN